MAKSKIHKDRLEEIKQAIEAILWAYATDPDPDIELYEVASEFGLSMEEEDIILDYWDQIRKEGEKLYSELEQKIKEIARKIIKSMN